MSFASSGFLFVEHIPIEDIGYFITVSFPFPWLLHCFIRINCVQLHHAGCGCCQPIRCDSFPPRFITSFAFLFGTPTRLKTPGGVQRRLNFEGNQSQAMGRHNMTRTLQEVVQKIPILDSFLVGSILCMFSLRKHLSERMPFDYEIILPNASSFFVRFSVVFGLSREFETY